MSQPQVEFRTGLRDKLGYAVRWLGVAYRRGVKVRVVGDAAQLKRLSQQLWLNGQEEFLAHALSQDLTESGVLSPGLERTHIWLGLGAISTEEPPLLLNLGAAVPENFLRYERVIELVASEEADRALGRARWDQYKKQGVMPVHQKPQDEGDTES